jgi:hypothetical protein
MVKKRQKMRVAAKQKYKSLLSSSKKLFSDWLVLKRFAALSAAVTVLVVAVIVVVFFATRSNNNDENEVRVRSEVRSPLADTQYDYTFSRNYVVAQGIGLYIREIWKNTIIVSYLLDDAATAGLATIQTNGQNFTPIWEAVTIHEVTNEFFHSSHQEIIHTAMRSDGTMLAIKYDFGLKEIYLNEEEVEEISLAGLTLMHMRLDGTVISETDLAAMFNIQEDYMFTVQNIQILSDGTVLIGLTDTLYILSPDLTPHSQFEWGIRVITFTATKDDRVFVHFWDYDAWLFRVLEYDILTGSFIEDVVPLLGVNLHNITGGSIFDLYFESEHAVYGLNLKTQEVMQLFNRQDEGIPTNFSIAVSEEGDILLLELDWLAWEAPTTSALLSITGAQ